MKKPLRVRSRHASTPVEREAVEGLALHEEGGGLTTRWSGHRIQFHLLRL